MCPEIATSGSLFFVKLGGSLITDKRRPETLRADIIQHLAVELAAAHRDRPGRLIVGHGSGSFGHAAAVRLGLDSVTIESGRQRDVSEIQDAAARLHRHVIRALLDAGTEPYSLVPSSAFRVSLDSTQFVATHLLGHLLDSGMLPVVYGDVVTDQRGLATILSTEALFAAMTQALLGAGSRVEGVLWLGETEGVFDAEGRLVSEVDAERACELANSVDAASGADVTGGMRLRLETAAALADLGVSSWIADGRSPQMISNVLTGSAVPCTLVRPGGGPTAD